MIHYESRVLKWEVLIRHKKKCDVFRVASKIKLRVQWSEDEFIYFSKLLNQK